MDTSQHWYLGRAPSTPAEQRQAETEAAYARESERMDAARFEEHKPEDTDDERSE